MKLVVRVYGEVAATIEAEEDRWARDQAIERGPAFERLSIGLPCPGASRHLYHWLEGALPENGALEPFKLRTELWRARQGRDPERLGVAEIAGANQDAEFPGAVSFHWEEEQAERKIGYRRVDEGEIGRRVRTAARIAEEGDIGEEDDQVRKLSASGVRGKIGLTRMEGGGWCIGEGAALNTWMVKHERRRGAPGQAGIESWAQETLRLLGLRSAETISRVFGGEQCVLSRRADRYWDRGTRTVQARHQEEYCQALGHPPRQKYDRGQRQEPRWAELYEVLRRHGSEPGKEQDALTQVLAAAWLLGHTDLHRRNIGLQHSLADEPRAVILAPCYDTASSIGTGFSDHLAIAIGHVRRLRTIGPWPWLVHARECGQSAEKVLALVREMTGQMPDAMAQARANVRERDENIEQDAVDERMNRTMEYARWIGEEFSKKLAKMRSRGSGRLPTDQAAVVQGRCQGTARRGTRREGRERD